MTVNINILESRAKQKKQCDKKQLNPQYLQFNEQVLKKEKNLD